MAYIKVVREHEAEGRLKAEYAKARERAGRIWQILQVQSLNPAALRDSIRFYGTLMFGRSELSRSVREMLAIVVSAVNRCHY